MNNNIDLDSKLNDLFNQKACCNICDDSEVRGNVSFRV